MTTKIEDNNGIGNVPFKEHPIGNLENQSTQIDSTVQIIDDYFAKQKNENQLKLTKRHSLLRLNPEGQSPRPTTDLLEKNSRRTPSQIQRFFKPYYTTKQKYESFERSNQFSPRPTTDLIESD